MLFRSHVGVDGSLTEIAGTRGTVSYTITTTDLGKEIVFASFGRYVGKYGVETLTIRSNSTGKARRFLKMLTPGTLNFTGPVPLIEYPAQCVAGTFDPPLVASAPGPYLATLQIGYLTDGKYPQYFNEVTTGWSSPRSFVIPDEADEIGRAHV